MSPSKKRPERTTAEWTTFGVAVAILLAVLAAIGVEAVRHHDDAQPTASVESTERVGEQYQVAVVVKNDGDKAAAEVQVVASLEINGETTDADQVVDFLAGGDEAELVFVFEDNPDDGELTVEVAGFAIP